MSNNNVPERIWIELFDGKVSISQKWINSDMSVNPTVEYILKSSANKHEQAAYDKGIKHCKQNEQALRDRIKELELHLGEHIDIKEGGCWNELD